MIFFDRRDAGSRLAERLRAHRGRHDTVVLALPRGGVPVGYEVALALGAPLDVFVVRKLGVPGHEELAMGALASGRVLVLNPDVVNAVGVPQELIERAIERERRELERRERAYRGDDPPPDVAGKFVILVDDGLATGATMLAAIAALRKRRPKRLMVAAPVAAPETCLAIAYEVDEIVCAHTPDKFHAVGFWYQDFSQTTDEEVRALLQQARASRASAPAPP